MDANAQSFALKKKELLNELADLMINGLKEGNLSVDESEQASRFVVEYIEGANDHVELKVWAEELVLHHPVFKPVLLSLEQEEAKQTDQQELADVQEKIEEIKTQTNQ